MAAITITLFGGFHVTSDGVPVTHFRGDKVRALLAYLAVESDRPHPRSALAALFWPELPGGQALNNLSQAITRLRSAFGEAEGGLLRTSRTAVEWLPGAAVDVTRFEQLARRSDHGDLAAAAALYSGELLAGFSLDGCAAFEEWLLVARERLRQLAVSVLERLAEDAFAAARFANAAAAARRLLEIEPWSEAAYRQLMRALAAGGDRAAALAAYERCRQVLLADLGIEPDTDTVALAQRIRHERATVAAPEPRAELPAPSTPLVGREQELEFVQGLLRGDERLVTILGAGGAGKTSLALAAAQRLRDAFDDGVVWVALASVNAAGDVSAQHDQLAAVIFGALGTVSSGRAPVLQELCHTLRARGLLLVLDNCEHLPALGFVVQTLLEAAPGVRVLATSRERIGVYGEAIAFLEGLAVPVEGDAAPECYDAVRLFLARARRAISGRDSAELEAVARLCRLLAGMPLGIELAAHLAGDYTPDEIAAAVRADLAFLATRDARAPDRHHSMRAVFEYSWRLLPEAERRALARLSVFADGFDRAAALAVAQARPALLAALADKSLLRRTGAGRYGMHELLRQFAAERLEHATGERDDAAARYRAHYLALLEEWERMLRGAGQPEALALIEREMGNIDAMLEQCYAAGRAEDCLRAVGLLWRFWFLRGRLGEWRRWQAVILAGTSGTPQDRARALSGAAFIAYFQGEYAQVAALCDEALAEARAARDPWLTALALAIVGANCGYYGDRARAEAILDEALSPARASGDAWLIAFVMSCSGENIQFQGRHAQARALLQESLALARTVGDRWLVANVLFNLGRGANAAGQSAEARTFHTEGLAVRRALGDRLGVAYALLGLAEVTMRSGDYAATAALHEERLAIERELRNEPGITAALGSLGWTLFRQGDYGRAAQLLTEELERARRFVSSPGLASALVRNGWLALAHGEVRRAAALFGEALALVRAINDAERMAEALCGLGEVALARERYCTLVPNPVPGESAWHDFRAALAAATAARHRWLMLAALGGVAVTEVRRGNAEPAAGLLRSVERLLASEPEQRERAMEIARAIPASQAPGVSSLDELVAAVLGATAVTIASRQPL